MLFRSLVLARIAGSGDFSDEILGAGREAVLGRATSPAKAGKPKAIGKKAIGTLKARKTAASAPQ